MNNEDQPVFPPKILNKIAEYSDGGYMLFLFDKEGNPNVFFHSEKQKDHYSLIRLAEEWVTKYNAGELTFLEESEDEEET
jgi:hypothetical protein